MDGRFLLLAPKPDPFNSYTNPDCPLPIPYWFGHWDLDKACAPLLSQAKFPELLGLQ